MRRAALLLAWLTLAAGALADEVRLAARDAIRLPYARVQAAFSLDASIVEASVLGAHVVLAGRRAGQTLVTVILPDSVQTLTVRIDPAPLALLESATAREGGGLWQAGYDSGLKRFTSSVFAKFGEGERVTRVRLEGLHELARPGVPANTAVPFASIEVTSPGRSFIL